MEGSWMIMDVSRNKTMAETRGARFPLGLREAPALNRSQYILDCDKIGGF